MDLFVKFFQQELPEREKHHSRVFIDFAENTPAEYRGILTGERLLTLSRVNCGQSPRHNRLQANLLHYGCGAGRFK